MCTMLPLKLTFYGAPSQFPLHNKTLKPQWLATTNLLHSLVYRLTEVPQLQTGQAGPSQSPGQVRFKSVLHILLLGPRLNDCLEQDLLRAGHGSTRSQTRMCEPT